MDFFTKQNDKEIEVLKRLADSLQQMQEADKSLDFSEEIEAVRIAVALFTMIGSATGKIVSMPKKPGNIKIRELIREAGEIIDNE